MSGGQAGSICFCSHQTLTRSLNYVTVANKFMVLTLPPLQSLQSSTDTNKSIHNYNIVLNVLREGTERHGEGGFTEEVKFKLRPGG